LSALHHGNEAVLDLMKPFFTTSGPVRRATRERSIADRLPTGEEAVEQWFGFWDGVLTEEKAFFASLVGLLPERTVESPVAKSAGKAA
jgi:hypothetical protein